MDDKDLAEQLKKTGNLMDLLNDTEWLKRNSAAEASCTGYVEAGAGLQSYVEQLKRVTPDAFKAQKQQVAVLSLLLPALHDWLDLWELGPSFESVYAEAQRLVYEHLTQATEMQLEWVEALLAADNQVVAAQAKESLIDLLKEEDWQALAKVAAQDMEKRVLHQAPAYSETPVAV